MDLDAYERQALSGGYPTLYGYPLVAPREHVELIHRDLDRSAYPPPVRLASVVAQGPVDPHRCAATTPAGRRLRCLGFYHGHRLDWYINVQAPYRRTPDGFDTLDHGIDIVVHNDGWQWKDRHDVAEQVAGGRLTKTEANTVWSAANRVATALNRGLRWWLPRWARWQPTRTQIRPDPKPNQPA